MLLIFYSLSSGLTFTFSVTGISPSSGSYMGGTEVTVTGSGFTDDVVVTVGEATCDSVVAANDGNSLTCVTTPHTATYTVSNDGTHSSKLDLAIYNTITFLS